MHRGSILNQALDRVLTKVTFKHARHLRLANTDTLPNLSLSQFPFSSESVNFRNDLSFQEMRAGIRQAEISKDIPASNFDFGPTSHAYSPSRNAADDPTQLSIAS